MPLFSSPGGKNTIHVGTSLVILKLVVIFVFAVVVVVALVVAAIFVQQGYQVLRFRWSMRSFAKNDAEDDDPALEVPKLKGTREEEQERQNAVWELFYRPGLSVAKLRASDRLRTNLAFTKPEWIKAEEWRGWHRLATRGSEAVRKRARDHACREAEGNLGAFPVRDLPLWLELRDEKERSGLALRWAHQNLHNDARRDAIRVLEDLATRTDAVAASALYELFQHHCYAPTRAKALAYAKRYFDQPKRTLDNVIRQSLRQLFLPELDEPVDLGSRWGVYGSKRAHLVVLVHALDVKAEANVWLDEPAAPLARASRGDELWNHPIPPSKFPFLDKLTRFFELPHLEGPLHVEVSAQLPAPPGWSECMGDEAMPIVKKHSRVSNTSLEAVLSLTENSGSTWVVDKNSKAPVANVPLTLMRRDDRGKIETQSSTTDEKGLFTWTGKASWQFGVLVERANSQGRQDQLFLTNSSDITTSKAPTPVRRFYVMLARPLYRPGERVQGKLFARQKGHEGPSKKLSQNLHFQLEVYAPRGLKIASLSLTLSEFGTAGFDFPIPTDAPLGRYTFRVVNSAHALEGSFHVEEFVAPEFRAELRAKDKPSSIIWGRKYALEFEATYFFGGPVANAQGTLDIKRTNWDYRNVEHGSFSKWFRKAKHIDSVPFKTDAQGRATIDLPWKGPWDLLGRFDGCDFNFVATVRDASGKSCQATLHLSVPRVSVVVSANPVRSLRLPGEVLQLALHWEPADAADDTPRKMTVICRKGRSKRTFVHEVRRSQGELEMPLDLPAGRWELSAHLEGQTSRARAKAPFTLLGPELEQRTRELVVSNDPTDSQGTIRVALLGPKTYCARELLVWNRGSRLGSKVIDRSSPTAWVELPYIAGREEQVHVSLWCFDTREEGLQQIRASAEINAPSIETKAPAELSLAFPAETQRPGAETSLEAKLGVPPEKPAELTVTVIDEAIFSLVPVPKSPLSFFEESPPRPEAYAAWSVPSARAQNGRQLNVHGWYGNPNDDSALYSMTQAGGFYEARSMDMPLSAAAPMAMMMPAAPKSASPMRAAASVVAAPVALVGAGAGLVVDAVMRQREKSKADEMEQQEAGAGAAAPAPVQLRSDFSSEAAWIPNARFARGVALTLPIKLPDTLTTWRASGVLVSLAHEHLLEAHARVRTQKPLMVRLQAPRFFQERDVLALRAMLDARSEQALSVRATLEARGFTLPESAQSTRTIEPHGQTRIDVELTVPTCQTQEIVVRAQAVATNVADASDAEERTVPYRPYGMLLRKTLSGLIAEESTSASFDLPAQRIKEFTALSIQIDRGPLDAVLHALSYLREYLYGCVEQTCSRLLPHLLWERLETREDEPSSVYRSGRNKIPEDVVQETLRRITSMQNGNGGFGWWPGGKSDLWMTAYVVFTYAVASQPESQSLQKARAYLTQHLLERDHADDADAFAAFALAWAGETVTDRVLEVLTSRWDGLSLTEKAKLCWVLAVQNHERAAECADEVKKALVGPAKRFLKKVARDDDEVELQWFHPGSTEAIAFFVLALLRECKGKHLSFDEETLEVLVSFLLQHRRGKRWHNTRDTALAVLALLAYEEALRGAGPDRQVEVHINAEKKRTATLARLGAEPISMQFGDEDLRPGANELSFVVDGAPGGGKIAQRHFSAELEYYTQEAEIAATGEGIEVERSYWLLDEKKEPKKQLRNGDKVEIGQRIRVLLRVKAAKPRTYLLLEDRKLAGCEPVAKKSGRDVCMGHCAHVELRADRTAIFFDALGTDRHDVSYDIEAILPGRFTAMPARIETMYETRCFATSASFALVVEEGG